MKHCSGLSSNPSATAVATLATAALLALAAPSKAQAQTQVQIYGTIDVAVGQISNQNPGPPTTAVTEVRGVFNGGVQTSYIGFRGSEDLGGGLSARFALESFLRVDTGVPGRFDASPSGGGDQFWSRNAYVGLAGSFGEVRLGTVGTPLWIAMLQTSAMGSNSVFSPSFRQLYNGGARGRSVIDTAMVNAVSWQSPVFGGVQGLAVLQAGEGRGTRYNAGGNLTYRAGPLVLAAAVQSARHVPIPALATTADQDMVLVGGAYDFGPVRAFAQYTTVDNVSNKSRLPHLGLTVPLGVGIFQLSSGEDRNRTAASGVETKRSTTSLGYLHALSKRTQLYGFLMTEEFPVVGPADNRGDSYAVGVRHTF